jgi:DNA ligase-1
MTQFKPMLASPADMSKLRFPLWLSPKLDGIRALVINGVVMSRSLKPIPNQHVQELFGHLEGYDGELIVGSPTDKDCFRNTTSGVMSRDGKPDVSYHVFDRHDLTACTWDTRYNSLRETTAVRAVRHNLVVSHSEIEEHEVAYLEQGFEGVMLRDPNGPYKNGRSTAKEGWLLKVKRFEDSEALVLGMEEKMHNGNEATVGELGQTKRTSHQENLVPLNTMGALIVRDLKTGVEFNIGTGFTDEERSWWWNEFFNRHLWRAGKMNNGGWIRECLDPNEFVKYKFFASGSKDKPRFPAYLGIRNKEDM